MWNDKGRSGYGDTNLEGTYDDVILGVSPNGRQYRNESTLEQRDLSGWTYWNLRKQNTPEQEIPESLYARNETESMSHTLKNGNANLVKYADPVVSIKKATSISLADRVLPQQRTLTKLISQIVELEQAKKAGTYTQSEYDLLRDVLFAKKQRTERLLAKARSQKPINTEESQPHTSPSKAPQHTHFPEQIATFSSNKARHSAKGDAKLFLGGVCLCFVAFMVLKMFM